MLKLIWFLERVFQANRSAIGAVSDGRREQRTETALRYFGWRKFLNFWRIELQLRMGRTKVSGYPYEWEIDTTNICQLKCPLCHTGLGTVHRDQGVMHYDTFTKVIDEIKGYCIWLTLYSWGEPFLNKDIDRYIAYAHKARMATTISTNLNKPLTADMVDRLIHSGLDTMIVSIDGVTQEVYEQYRVLGRLDRVLANLKLIVERKQALGSSTPHIEWQFIVMRQNQHQIPDAQALADEIGVDSIVFKKVDFPLWEQDTEIGRKWMPVGIEGHERDSPFDRPYEEDGDRCWRLWRSSVINWDGGAAPCCYLTDKADDFGDVTHDSFRSIWNNDAYQSARQLFKKGAPYKEHVGCETCPVYTGTEAARLRGHDQAHPSANGSAVPVELSLTKRGNGHMKDEAQGARNDDQVAVSPEQEP